MHLILAKLNFISLTLLDLFFSYLLVLLCFLGEIVLTAAYLLNWITTNLLSDASPYDGFFGQVPEYSFLCALSSACFVLLLKRDRTKLWARCVILIKKRLTSM